MATTVTYKGATLTTVDNATKVLETAGTWMEDDLTLTDVSGGGGSCPMVLLDTITISESVRSYQIDIQNVWRAYDNILFYVQGEFESSDWLYWNVDATTLDSGKYTPQSKTIDYIFGVVSIPLGNNQMCIPLYVNSNNKLVTQTNMTINIQTMGYFWLSGYSKNITTGTTIKVYGVNYADL